MAMLVASASAQGTGELTQADHATAASSALTGCGALLANLGLDLVSARIKAGKSQRQQMLAEKVNARALPNAQRQRSRLKRKARHLSTDDLVEVLTCEL